MFSGFKYFSRYILFLHGIQLKFFAFRSMIAFRILVAIIFTIFLYSAGLVCACMSATGDTDYEMWTHGSSVQPQNPQTLRNMTRFGYGTLIEGIPSTDENAIQWFHFAVPTPAFAWNNRRNQSQRLEIVQVRIKFWTGGTATRVRSVNVWDANNLIAEYTDREQQFTELYGDQRNPYRTFGIRDRRPVEAGIGISMGVIFGLLEPDTPGAGYPVIEFNAAGAVFTFPREAWTEGEPAKSTP
jgi:hypothetical protein